MKVWYLPSYIRSLSVTSKAPFDSWSIRRIQVDPCIASKSILAGSWFTGLWEQMILPSFSTWVILNWILLVLLVEISCFYVYFHVFLSCIKSICLSFLVAKTNRKFTFPLATFQSPMTKIYARIIETFSCLFDILATAIQLHRGCRKRGGIARVSGEPNDASWTNIEMTCNAICLVSYIAI